MAPRDEGNPVSATDPQEQEDEQGPVIRDNRRIDPKTGQARGGSGSADKATPQVIPDEAAAAQQLMERTADLQRLQAEYANYRKRVDRDRGAVREQALANVLTELLPILDDIGRAKEHGELTGGFKSIAEALEAVTVKLGLTAYGQKGEPFDPNVHEALMHSYSADVGETTCVEVLQPGYKVGDRILRAARVVVAEPEAGEPVAPGDVADGPAGTDGGNAEG